MLRVIVSSIVTAGATIMNIEDMTEEMTEEMIIAATRVRVIIMIVDAIRVVNCKLHTSIR
jgi:hypothetical protein